MTGSIGGGYTSGEKTIKILYGENFSKERTITIKVIPSLKTENFSIKSGETVLNIKETAGWIPCGSSGRNGEYHS